MQHPDLIKKLLQTLVTELPGIEGVRLIDIYGGTVAEAGVCNPPYTRFEFLQGRHILLSKPPEQCGIQERAAVRTIKEIYKIFDSLAKEDMSGKYRTYRSSELYPALFRSLLTHIQSTARNAQLEQILNISSEILQAKDLKTTLNVLVAMAKEAVQADDASVLLSDPKTDEICFFIVDGEDAEKLQEIRIPSGRGIAGSVIASGQGEIIQDAARDPRFYINVDRTTGKITRDMIASPIYSDDRVAGVIEVINSKRKGGFTREDLEFLNSIAKHMGLLLENARNHEYLIRTRDSLDEKSTELNLFYNITEILSSRSVNRRSEFLRAILGFTNYRRAELLTSSASSHGTLTGIFRREASFPADRPDEVPDTVLHGASDIIIWLKNQNEPFFLHPRSGLSGRPEGILKRFFEANPDLKPESFPDAFILLSSSPLLILSLSDPAGRTRLPSNSSFYSALRRLAESSENLVPETASAPEIRSMKIFRGSVLVISVSNLEDMENRVTPAGLRRSLDEFHAVIAKEIKRFGGQVLVTSGDHLTAVFAQKQRKGPLNSRAALDCCMAIREHFRNVTFTERKDSITPPLLRYGIHTGTAYKYRNPENTEFGLAGTLITTAWYLARLNLYYNTDVILSESAAGVLLNERPEIRETDMILLPGSSRPLPIYSIQQTPLDTKYREQWQMAVKEYQKGNFSRALILFEGIPDQNRDPLLMLYIRRCMQYTENPPDNINSIYKFHL